MLANTFVPLPTSMRLLETVVQSMDKVEVVPPPDISSIGLRLRKLYAEWRADDYKGLPKSSLRKLPFAYWVEGQPALPGVEPELVKRYWRYLTIEASQGNPRRAKRWLSPLFYVYCVSFDNKNESFLNFATLLNHVVPKAKGEYAAKLVEMNSSSSIFKPSEAPVRLATRLFTSSTTSLSQAMTDCLLWPGFEETPLGFEVLNASLGFSETSLTDSTTVNRLLDWVEGMSAPVHKSSLRIQFANAILEPWYRRKPPDELRRRLLHFFVSEDSYGDPRLEGHREYQWGGVSEKAVSTVFNWLTGDTLKVFISLLARTADQIWRYREKFWMAYYERGHIDEAWLALGPDALREVRTLVKKNPGIRFGRLDGGISNNHSVLLLRLGNLIFTEWSHNGSLRAYSDGDGDTPNLYQSIYSGYELRDAPSLDFHNGTNVRPELAHHHSNFGTWQRKARDFIRRNTGIYLTDSEIA